MSNPQVIEGNNLSDAWVLAFQMASKSSADGTLHNLTVAWSVYGEGEELFLHNNENQQVRDALDAQLMNLGKSTVATVASTIFPISLWNPNEPPQSLYDRYAIIWPRIRRCRPNGNGTYFQRMIAFGWEEDRGNQLDSDVTVNQLQHVIETYERGNHRGSALSAAIMNPRVDHTHQRRRGFPCLQYVHFAITPHQDQPNEMTVTGVYATQLLLEKAYGNYLGLHRLGQFMAPQMGAKLTRVVCTASYAKLSDGIPKRNLIDLQDLLDTA